MKPLAVISNSNVLTTSRLKCYRRCPREHLFAYEMGYRPVVEAEALRFGTLVHRALEAWWRAPIHRLEAAVAALAEARDTDPYDVAKARALLKGYDARWGAEPLEVLTVEIEFTAPLVNPQSAAPSRTWILGGKIDAIVRDQRDGRILIVEHKTAADDIRAGSDYWKRLRLDAQVGTYYVGAKALGYEVAGCLYDVIGKPWLRPHKATPPETRKYTKEGRLYAGQRERDETPDEYERRILEDVAASPEKYFARGEVVRLEQDLDDLAFDLWQLGKQVREAELANRWPRNPDACVRWGRTCEFFPKCSGEASLDDPTRYRRITRAHEELGPAPAA